MACFRSAPITIAQVKPGFGHTLKHWRRRLLYPSFYTTSPIERGVNLENDTIVALAEHPNIVGLKDACGNLSQSIELLAAAPRHFSILTGEDALFYVMLVLGAQGGILASAHHATPEFVKVYEAVKANDHLAALRIWRPLTHVISLLFSEPNPAPIKALLAARKLITSAEVRLPLVPVTDALSRRLLDLIEESRRERTP
jgi:4-hydroxy-tetrahydrodipicolinate synthase